MTPSTRLSYANLLFHADRTQTAYIGGERQLVNMRVTLAEATSTQESLATLETES